jgi:hypothetical protein
MLSDDWSHGIANLGGGVWHSTEKRLFSKLGGKIYQHFRFGIEAPFGWFAK